MKVHPKIVLGNARLQVAAYTLVEVMIATLLLGIMMAIFFSGFSQGYLSLNTARQDLRATQILTQKTETVRLCTWAQLTNLPNSFVEYYTGSGTNVVNGVYFGQISVANATNIPNSVSYYGAIKLVTISVTWTNYISNRAVPHSRQMQTLASRDGMVNYIYGYTP